MYQVQGVSCNTRGTLRWYTAEPHCRQRPAGEGARDGAVPSGAVRASRAGGRGRRDGAVQSGAVRASRAGGQGGDAMARCRQVRFGRREPAAGAGLSVNGRHSTGCGQGSWGTAYTAAKLVAMAAALEARHARAQDAGLGQSATGAFNGYLQELWMAMFRPEPVWQAGARAWQPTAVAATASARGMREQPGACPPRWGCVGSAPAVRGPQVLIGSASAASAASFCSAFSARRSISSVRDCSSR